MPEHDQASCRWWSSAEIQAKDFLNARDLGGLPMAGGGRTVFGCLFRCGAESWLLPPLVSWLADRSEQPVHVFDLRSSREIDPAREDPSFAGRAVGLPTLRDPASRIADRPEGRPTIRVFRHSFALDDPAGCRVARDRATAESFAEHYARLLPTTFPLVAEVLRTVSIDPGPVVLACRLGKDRTGVASMVLLKAIGVPDHWIVRDFMRSGRWFVRHQSWVSLYAAERGEPQDAVLRRLVLPPSVPRRTLAELQALTGSSQERLLSLIGIDEKTTLTTLERCSAKPLPPGVLSPKPRKI